MEKTFIDLLKNKKETGKLSETCLSALVDMVLSIGVKKRDIYAYFGTDEDMKNINKVIKNKVIELSDLDPEAAFQKFKEYIEKNTVRIRRAALNENINMFADLMHDTANFQLALRGIRYAETGDGLRKLSEMTDEDSLEYFCKLSQWLVFYHWYHHNEDFDVPRMFYGYVSHIHDILCNMIPTLLTTEGRDESKIARVIYVSISRSRELLACYRDGLIGKDYCINVFRQMYDVDMCAFLRGQSDFCNFSKMLLEGSSMLSAINDYYKDKDKDE